MKEIEDFIHHLECPLINGIVFADNTIHLFDEATREKPSEIKLYPSSATSILDLEKQGELFWCSCAILGTRVDEASSVKAFCGEGNFGGDGFVAVIDMREGKLIWVAYFTCSNPFYKVEIKAGRVIAFSTAGFAWGLDIDKPLEIGVKSLS